MADINTGGGYRSKCIVQCTVYLYFVETIGNNDYYIILILGGGGNVDLHVQ